MKTVIIDNGHGAATAGKCSPDGRLKEWHFNRRLARAVAKGIKDKGIPAVMLVPEDADVPLSERIRRVRALAAAAPSLLVSLHVNASGRGAWGTARGWSAFVAPRASVVACALARRMTELAREAGLEGNRRTPLEGFWRAPLALCRGTPCPAVLTENMFMDNRSDLEWLLGDDAVALLAQIHCQAIEEFAL